jgi:hypothetical protein
MGTAVLHSTLCSSRCMEMEGACSGMIAVGVREKVQTSERRL